MIPLSIDEQRIVRALQRLAEAHEAKAKANPFSLHKVRAAVLLKAISGIKKGVHR